MLLKTLTLILCLAFSPLMLAQQAPQDFKRGALTDLTTVGLCGLGGAVLGLSTLPFTEEPGDHLKNILVGGAIGIIVGVGIVAWTQARGSGPTGGAEYEGERGYYNWRSQAKFSTEETLAWHKKFHQSHQEAPKATQFAYQFSF